MILMGILGLAIGFLLGAMVMACCAAAARADRVSEDAEMAARGLDG